MRPGVPYYSISRGVNNLMDGGEPRSFAGALWTPPAVKAYGSTLSTIYSLALGRAVIQNRTGTTIVCGIAGRHHPSMWRAGQWVHATTTFTDDSVDAQDAGTADFPLETLTNGDGFVILTRFPANCFVLKVATASVTGAPTRVIEYSQGGGQWGTIVNPFVPPPTAGAHYAIGETLILFETPTDLGVIDADYTTEVGLPLGFYAYRIRATTAPTGVAGVADSLSVASVVGAIEGLVHDNVYEMNPASSEYRFDPCCDSLYAVLSSKATVESKVSVEVRVA